MSSTLTAPTTSTPLFPQANYINGTWQSEGDGEFTLVLDKYHGTEMAKLPLATAAQVEEAVAAAFASRDRLRRMSAGERSEKLEALAHLMEERKSYLQQPMLQI